MVTLRNHLEASLPLESVYVFPADFKKFSCRNCYVCISTMSLGSFRRNPRGIPKLLPVRVEDLDRMKELLETGSTVLQDGRRSRV